MMHPNSRSTKYGLPAEVKVYRIKLPQNTVRWLIRLFAIFISIYFTKTLVAHFAYVFHDLFSLEYWKYAIWYTIEAWGVNIGYWMATTDIGQRFKYITFILLLPSIILAPLAMPETQWLVGAIVVTTLNMGIVIFLFKTKAAGAKDERDL